MLSRTAEGLFWLGRYVERAENLARLLEAGRRFELMSTGDDTPTNEWGAILIAAGCSNTFEAGVEDAASANAIRHICTDPANPSSIQACFVMARSNARAQRVALTAETWSAVNDAWREVRNFSERSHSPRNLAGTIERVRQLAALFRGSVEGTMLRDEGYDFLRVGQLVERADATSRLLDVKYHVLMTEEHPVGSSLDQLQWNHLLRAAGARSSYRVVYRAPVRSKLVIDFLVLNRACPRSLRFCYEGLCRHLSQLNEATEHGAPSLAEAAATRDGLRGCDVNGIFSEGLHEYLTKMVSRTNKLALSIGSDYGFGPVATTSQTQAQ